MKIYKITEALDAEKEGDNKTKEDREDLRI